MTQSSMGAQSVETTFYWYDYETFGVDPRKDRPAQFAGRRTRLDFSPLSGDTGEIFYCRPTEDQLPNPESCLLTGITPQYCAEKGVCESEFADLIWERLNTPGTVSIGYNTLGFDDEVIASSSGAIFLTRTLIVGQKDVPDGIYFLLSVLHGRFAEIPSSGLDGKRSIQ